MKTLAGGKSQKTILKLLRILINTSQSNFGDLALDDGCIRDIADVITADTPVDVQASVRRSSPSPGRQAAATFQGEEIKEQEDEVRADGKRLAYVWGDRSENLQAFKKVFNATNHWKIMSVVK